MSYAPIKFKATVVYDHKTEVIEGHLPAGREDQALYQTIADRYNNPTEVALLEELAKERARLEWVLDWSTHTNVAQAREEVYLTKRGQCAAFVRDKRNHDHEKQTRDALDRLMATPSL